MMCGRNGTILMHHSSTGMARHLTHTFCRPKCPKNARKHPRDTRGREFAKSAGSARFKSGAARRYMMCARNGTIFMHHSSIGIARPPPPLLLLGLAILGHGRNLA